MKPLISTPLADIYGRPLHNGDGMNRREVERRAAQSLVKAIFGEEAEIGHHESGAPYIIGREELKISISHSSSTLLLAIGKGEGGIGIDIEGARERLIAVRRKFLSDAELRRAETLAGSDAELPYLQKCWTAKEAVYKCALTPGLGLREIETDTWHHVATARGKTYQLEFHTYNGDELIAVAAQIKTDDAIEL